MSLLARAAAISPFGPIFGKELRVTSRRKRTYLLRMGYLGLLLLALLLAYATTGRSFGGVAAQMQRQAALGTAFFAAFTIFSVASMGLMGPVLTANAIGAEKLAKTLPVLLMTPISAWQVVSGKLFSRVLIALMLLGLSMPVLALCRLLGGVELEQMLAVLLIAISHVISCAAIGLFFSLFLNRAAIVILLSYAVLGVLYVLIPVMLIVLGGVAKNGPRGGSAGIQFLASINPLGCAMAMIESRARSGIGNAWIACVIVQLVFAALLLAWSAAVLRRQFRNGGERAIALPLPPMGAGPITPPPFAPTPPPLSERYANIEDGSAEVAPPPIVDYRAPRTAAAKPSKVADVYDNPVLWREMRRPLLPKLWQRAVGVGAVVTIMLIVYAIQAEGNDLDDIDSHIGYSCVFFGLWWILSAVLSATAISQEKESDTWTLLLTTPMNGRQIVWGKIAGLLRRLIWPTVLILAHFMLFVIGGIIPLWSVLFVLVILLCCNSVWIATGVWLSLRIKKVTFAVVANLMLAIVVYGVVPLMVLIPAELINRRGDRVASYTGYYIPYFYLAQGFEGLRRADYSTRYPGQQRYYSSDSWDTKPYWLPNDNVKRSTFLTYATLCAIGHLALALLILNRTANTFDEIVGRAGRRQFVGIADTDDAVLPASGTPPPPSTTDLQPAKNADEKPVNLAADQYASPGRRLVAWAVDFLIVQFCCGVVGLVWGVMDILNEAVEETSDDVMTDQLRGYFAVSMLVGLAVGWLYWAIFEASRRRATPGKMLLGIFVTDKQGRRIGFARATVRYFSKFLSTLPLGIGLLYTFANKRRQAMHDDIASTLVLRK